jgi:hypothetical protein
LSQGFQLFCLQGAFRKYYGRYNGLIYPCNLSLGHVLSDITCRLALKLQNPKFIEFIQNNENICLSETKHDKAYNIDIDNFHVFHVLSETSIRSRLTDMFILLISIVGLHGKPLVACAMVF